MQKKESNKLIYSVLGDSVSTFEGITPSEAVFYDSYIQAESGIMTPEDTWWMKVIRAKDGVLGSNHSLAGSTVSGRLLSSGTSARRQRALAQNGAPDVILVNMGANDWGFGVLPEEFKKEYQDMIYTLKLLYPQAQIWCGTILEGELPADRKDAFFNVDACISSRMYSDIIRDIARKADVHLADTARHGISYSTIDGVHPDKKGMETIASLWLREM